MGAGYANLLALHLSSVPGALPDHLQAPTMERFPLRMTHQSWSALLTINKRQLEPGEPMLTLAWPFDRVRISERIARGNIRDMPASCAGKLFVVVFEADATVTITGGKS